MSFESPSLQRLAAKIEYSDDDILSPGGVSPSGNFSCTPSPSGNFSRTPTREIGDSSPVPNEATYKLSSSNVENNNDGHVTISYSQFEAVVNLKQRFDASQEKVAMLTELREREARQAHATIQSLHEKIGFHDNELSIAQEKVISLESENNIIQGQVQSLMHKNKELMQELQSSNSKILYLKTLLADRDESDNEESLAAELEEQMKKTIDEKDQLLGTAWNKISELERMVESQRRQLASKACSFEKVADTSIESQIDHQELTDKPDSILSDTNEQIEVKDTLSPLRSYSPSKIQKQIEMGTAEEQYPIQVANLESKLYEEWKLRVLGILCMSFLVVLTLELFE